MTLSDPELTQAVSKILLRSERVATVGQLQHTFVDTGVLPQLLNDNNQIIYGRRGTGKSHLLRVLGAGAAASGDVLDVYVDLRTLGSAQQVADASRPFPQRCLTLFKDLLLAIHESLMDAATDPARDAGDLALLKVDDFGETITRLSGQPAARDVSLTVTTSRDREVGFGLAAKLSALEASISRKTTAAQEATRNETYHETLESSLIYGDIARTLEIALTELRVRRLLLLLDEWTTLDTSIQPVFAEFLKRTFLPSRWVTLKVASLEYRSRFSLLAEANQVVGFEVGGDISASMDLDDYYVYDRNPTSVVETFQEILHKHISAELPPSYAARTGLVDDPDTLRRRLFTERATFVELVRAGEGVVRDFISIFNRAYFLAQRSSRRNIDVRSVREAARQWYETDKAINLSDEQTLVLQRILTDVIGAKRARSFLLDRRLARHHMVESLFDFRVLHIISKGYSDRDNPGLRYNIYTLDYGTYVELLQTQRQPELDLELGEAPGEERVVPFDDKRSIRRVIVHADILDVRHPNC